MGGWWLDLAGAAVFDGDEVVFVFDGDRLGRLVHAPAGAHQVVRRRPVIGEVLMNEWVDE